jgi:hypothetical protein
MINLAESGYQIIPLLEMDQEQVFSLWWQASRLVISEEIDRTGTVERPKPLVRAARQAILSLQEASAKNPESAAIAIFKDHAPKLFLHYLVHNDDPDPDYITLKLCQSFGNFLETDEGREVGQAAVANVLQGGQTSHPPYFIHGRVPEDFFEPFLRKPNL